MFFPGDLLLKGGMISVKGDLHGTTLSHATTLQQAYDTNCFV